MARSFAVKRILKNMYPATHNFKDDAVGTTNNDISIFDYNSGDDSAHEAIIVALEDGHRKLVKFTAAGDDGKFWRWRRNFADQTGTKTFEFWGKYIDKGIGLFEIMFLDSEGATIARLRFNSTDNKFYVYHAATNTSVAATADTFYHIGITLNVDTDTQSVWLNGVNIVSDVAFYNSETVANIAYCYFYLRGGGGANSLEAYIDAWGESWDTDYTVGDNIFWRNLKDQDSNFEAEALYTSSTDIGFIDVDDSTGGANTTVTIIPSFDEHKKILELYDNDAAALVDCYNIFASSQPIGTIAFYWKTSDATKASRVAVQAGTIIGPYIYIVSELFQVRESGEAVTSTGVTALDNTEYLIKIVFDVSTDTYDLWIDNVYINNYAFFAVCGNLDRIRLLTDDAQSGYYAYFNSLSYSWTSGNVLGDNRLLEYNDHYTRDDITTEIITCTYENELHRWRTATIKSEKVYDNTMIFQIYDINSKLAFEGEIKTKTQIGSAYRYPLRDKNWDDLNEPNTQVFTTAKIHDPSMSGCMLKTALPNVNHVDGDLLLSTSDTKTATYSPTLRNYPTYMFLRDLSDVGDTVTIIKANGIVLFDDDLASGDSLDIDTPADKDKFGRAPIPTDIIELINYFEIYGAMNPDTGLRFSKIIDNSGTDKKRKWRYVNNNFHSQADVDNYAAALVTRTTTIKQIEIVVQGFGAHNMGETFNFKYVAGDYNIPQANYYIIKETINFDTATSVITLSEGLLEGSKYAAKYEKSFEESNVYASEIYETDINTVYPELYDTNGTELSDGIDLNAVGKSVNFQLYIPSTVDPNRNIIITWLYSRVDVGGGSIDIQKYGIDITLGGGSDTFWPSIADTLDGETQDYFKKIWTINNTNVNDDHLYKFRLILNEADREIIVHLVCVQYYIKRSV